MVRVSTTLKTARSAGFGGRRRARARRLRDRAGVVQPPGRGVALAQRRRRTRLEGLDRILGDSAGNLTLWPAPGGDFEIMKRIKHMFDPEGLLNSGRLYGRI